MLSFEDCLAFCDLTEDEIDAIAEHEHIPDIVAVELGNYLIQSPDGTLKIRRMILDDIELAREHGNLQRYLGLKATLKHFVDTHPDNPDRSGTD